MPLESPKREAKRNQLFVAALKIMGEHGYKDASIEEITRTAGVTRSSFYYYFESKTDLVEKMVDASTEMQFKAFERALAPNMGTRDAFLAISRALYLSVWRHPAFAKFILSEMWHQDEEWHPALSPYVDDSIEIFSNLIMRGQKEKTFDPDLNVPLASRSVFTTLCSSAIAHKEGQIKGSNDAIARQAVALALRGVACDSKAFSVKS